MRPTNLFVKLLKSLMRTCLMMSKSLIVKAAVPMKYSLKRTECSFQYHGSLSECLPCLVRLGSEYEADMIDIKHLKGIILLPCKILGMNMM